MAKDAKKAPKAKKDLPQCLCGCGAKVGSPRSRFRPGHDAKVHSMWVTEPAKLSPAAQAFAKEKGWTRGGDAKAKAKPAKAKKSAKSARKSTPQAAPAAATA